MNNTKSVCRNLLDSLSDSAEVVHFTGWPIKAETKVVLEFLLIAQKISGEVKMTPKAFEVTLKNPADKKKLMAAGKQTGFVVK